MNNDMTDEEIEKEIQSKGLAAPRVTLAHVDSVIAGETFTMLPSGRTMICELTLANGFTVRGESSVVSHENFNEELGRKDLAHTRSRSDLAARSLPTQGEAEVSDAAGLMPQYECHKKVRALQIKTIVPGRMDDKGATLYFVKSRYAPISISDDWNHKFKPQPGGYYVVYEDGYVSYSPAKAFEEGYTRIPMHF